MRIFYETDVGLVRSCNQDCARGGVFGDGSVWAVLCDGMGGANGGEYASLKAVDVISEQLEHGYRSGMSGSKLHELMQNAIEEANRAVYDAAIIDTALAGMGTTVVVTIVCGGSAYIAHAGDSRAYIISGSRIRQITKDHSIVQEMVDYGLITEDEAQDHPRKNIITRALGVYRVIDIDFNDVELENDEMLLMCSDGLSNTVASDEMMRTAAEVPAEELPAAYIKKACENGGSDNITAVVICR